MGYRDNAFLLVDTFNCRVISWHRKEEAAREADRKLQRDIKRHSKGAYLPTVILAPCAGGPGVRERNMPRIIGYGTHAPSHLVVDGKYRPVSDADRAFFDRELEVGDV